MQPACVPGPTKMFIIIIINMITSIITITINDSMIICMFISIPGARGLLLCASFVFSAPGGRRVICIAIFTNTIITITITTHYMI